MKRLNTLRKLNRSLHTTALALTVLGLTAALMSCNGVQTQASAPPGPPPDFALVVTVQSIGKPPSAAMRSAQYVLTADGTLHAAVGPGSSHDLMPAPTATLSPAQRQNLWLFVLLAGIDEPPVENNTPKSTKNDVAQNGSETLLTTAVTARGRVCRQEFTVAQRPLVVSLLNTLARLRGDAPSPDNQPPQASRAPD